MGKSLYVLSSELIYSPSDNVYPHHWFSIGYYHKLCKLYELDSICLLSLNPEKDAEQYAKNPNHELHGFEEATGLKVFHGSLKDIDFEDEYIYIAHFCPPKDSAAKFLFTNFGITDVELFQMLNKAFKSAEKVFIEDSDSEYAFYINTPKDSTTITNYYSQYEKLPNATFLMTQRDDYKVYLEQYKNGRLKGNFYYVPCGLTSKLWEYYELPINSLNNKKYLTYFAGSMAGRPHVGEFIRLANKDKTHPSLLNLPWFDYPKLGLSHEDYIKDTEPNRVDRKKFLQNLSDSMFYIQGASWYKRGKGHPLNVSPRRYTSKLIECVLAGTLLITLDFEDNNRIKLPSDYVMSSPNSKEQSRDAQRVYRNYMELINSDEEYKKVIQEQRKKVREYCDYDGIVGNGWWAQV